MRFLLAALAALAGLAVAPAAEAGTVSMGLRRQALGKPPLVRRATWTQNLANNATGGGYFAEVKIGTPGQTFHLHLDTGSSDTWVLDVASDLCNSPQRQREYGFCIATCT